MFCSNCGAEAAEGAVFCESCGARLEPPVPDKGEGRRVKPLPFIIGGAALIAALAVVLICVFAANSPERTAKAAMSEAMKVFTTGTDAEKLYSLFSKKLMRLQAEDSGLTEDEVVAMLQNSFDSRRGEFRKKYPDADISFSVSVAGTDDFPETTLEKIDDELSEKYRVRCTDAREVILHIGLNVNGRKGTAQTRIIVYKLDGRWCLYKWLPSLLNAEDAIEELLNE